MCRSQQFGLFRFYQYRAAATVSHGSLFTIAKQLSLYTLMQLCSCYPCVYNDYVIIQKIERSTVLKRVVTVSTTNNIVVGFISQLSASAWLINQNHKKL